MEGGVNEPAGMAIISFVAILIGGLEKIVRKRMFYRQHHEGQQNRASQNRHRFAFLFMPRARTPNRIPPVSRLVRITDKWEPVIGKMIRMIK